MAKKKVVEKLPSIFMTSSDWHIGHLPVEQLEYEFFGEGGFLEKIVEYINFAKENDFRFLGLMITGDIFHKQLNLNSKDASFAFVLFQALFKIIIEENDSNIVIIRGTYGHDYSQLNSLKPFMNTYPDRLFIYDTLDELTLEGYDILCIPEEYMKNQDEYYKEAFSKKRDILLAHGFMKMNCFNKNEVERRMPDMPIFDEKQLVKICRVGIFGHDHHHSNFEEHIWYNGSLSRNAHGEEEAKGFLVHYIDKDVVETEFVENELALTFKTFHLDDIIKPVKETGLIDFAKLVKKVNKLYEQYDNIKIKVAQHNVTKQPEIIDLLKDYYIKYGSSIIIEGAGIKLTTGEYINIKSEEDDEDEKLEETEGKYEFLNDTAINIDEKIKKFIEVKHENRVKTELSLEFIREAISPEV